MRYYKWFTYRALKYDFNNIDDHYIIDIDSTHYLSKEELSKKLDGAVYISTTYEKCLKKYVRLYSKCGYKIEVILYR